MSPAQLEHAEQSTPGSYAWPEERPARWAAGLVAVLVAALLVFTTAANWVEDRFVAPAEGGLLIDSVDGKVYRYENGTRRHIVNVETMGCWRQPGQHFIRYRLLDEIPEGPPIQNREGCRSLPPLGFLVQPIDDQRVFLSTGYSLRLVPNARTLDCVAGLRDIEQVAPGYLDLVPIGPVLPDGAFCQ